MKARGLQNEGISTWIWTGSYQIPSPTITGNVSRDIAMIDKVVGLKIAFSDHRSSHASEETLIQAIASSRIGGIVGGKSGKVMVHRGNPTDGLSKLREILSRTEIPLSQVIPTHLNRTEALFEESIIHGKAGGNIDITAGVSEKYHFGGTVKPSSAVSRLISSGVPIELISMSSDGNGSMAVPQADGTFKMLVSPVQAMYEEFTDMLKEGVPCSDAIRVVSGNPAKALGLLSKGKVASGADADLLLISKEDFSLSAVWALGKKMVENDVAIVKGVFED
jgi:beta-aspartyl-dipeptidase (metallo-type)